MDVTLTAIAWLCWPNDFTTSTVGASLALIFLLQIWIVKTLLAHWAFSNMSDQPFSSAISVLHFVFFHLCDNNAQNATRSLINSMSCCFVFVDALWSSYTFWNKHMPQENLVWPMPRQFFVQDVALCQDCQKTSNRSSAYNPYHQEHLS